jgi:tRNA 2-thiouridine synthesizing protein A
MDTMATPESAEEIIDLRGLKCPLPALLARRALGRSPAGTVLTVLADDPLAAVDVPHMCHEEGFRILAVAQSGSEVRITIRKPDAPAGEATPPS